jgi:uncharacterized protein
MKATEGKLGRVFVIRLENGDKLPNCIEQFAEDHGISHAQVLLLGGIGDGQIVSGPRYSDRMPPDPVLIPVDGAHEVIGVGLLVPGEDNKPILHIHAALGRTGHTIAGCLRPGVATWLVGEVILCELIGIKARRMKDEASGFELLEPT